MNGLLNRSAGKKQQLEMIYLDSKGVMSQRIIRVLNVSENDLLAYCYTRRKGRTFKKENILSVGPVWKKMGA
ncbi:hypothetical protein MUO14_09300 [Halobacillus shinanisalinarum]|uniref:WYL domain-containing protein n=1 Tax=Halobacillus shinanisalinarum TaxID=2932258 RepID=A0ABY4H4S5_9BACI|nr:hypothetical protein [Halobacillus shinanisalinarum]UOQ95100.1 hypothetical protein MUO14_09300 [Halobacillus shinanisalinarum]